MVFGSDQLMNVSPIFILLLSLFCSPPTPKGNIFSCLMRNCEASRKHFQSAVWFRAGHVQYVFFQSFSRKTLPVLSGNDTMRSLSGN